MRITLLDLSTLLRALIEAERHSGIGHLDAEKSLKELVRVMNKKVDVDEGVVESALYSCRLLEAEGKTIGHPYKTTTKDLIRALTPEGHFYNEEYHMFEENYR